MNTDSNAKYIKARHTRPNARKMAGGVKALVSRKDTICKRTGG